MKKYKYISILTLMICLLTKAYAQVVPWTVTSTANSQEIVIKNTSSSVKYDLNFNTIGDAIGVFYDQSGTLVCGGYLQLDGTTTSFLVYGNDAVDNGFQNAEIYYFMYWRKNLNCIIELPAGAVIMDDMTYSTGGSDTIFTLNAIPASVKYQKDYYCIYTPPQGILQITGTTFSNLNITFPPLLYAGVDPANGNIEAFTNVTPGTYTVTMTTNDNTCLHSPSFSVSISDHLLTNPSIVSRSSNCNEATGSIELDTSTLLNGTKPYTFSLKNISTDIISFSASGLFTNLPAGKYKLIIQDLYVCADTITVTIESAPANCDNITDIITPLKNSNYSEVFLPWEGSTKVYNSQGQLINSFTTPANWDGRDQRGQYVPTGAYFIFTEGKKMKEITVIY